MDTSSSSVHLTSCQTKALDVLQREGNVFLTGAAGTGKSFLLDQYLRGKGLDDFPIVASTGAAAVIVGGRTFHSFFGLGIMEGGPQMAVDNALRSRRVRNRLQRASCVIIDEVSMLSGSTLMAAEAVAQRARERSEPWGGLRIIVVGDFAQLPPVTSGQQKDWGFLHPVWEKSDFEPALLTTVMRTQDTDFLDILNFIRDGVVNDRVHQFLERHIFTDNTSLDATRLYPHRAKADEYNWHRLQALLGKEYAVQTEYAGDEKYLERAKKSLPIPDTLLLKVGALIMMRRNDVSGENKFVNGSLGHVQGVEEDVLHVRLFTGEDIEVAKYKFSVLDGDGHDVMSAWNFPVSLAWATTIHKAQGATLDRMIVDLHQLWEPGQAYVALSRVRSADGLFIERWSKESIRADALVTSFYDSLSDRASRYTPRPFFNVTKQTEESPRSSLTMSERIAMTRSLLQERKDLAFIATQCGMTVGTVLKYIEKLIGQGTVPSISYLVENTKYVDKIRALYEERGLQSMREAFDAFEGKISYDDLKLVKVVMMAEG
jgi:ATP-dependent DNA helicase PIF1